MTQHSSHTHCQAAQAQAQTQTWQRVCLLHPDKIELNKSPLPFESKKYATTQTNTTQTKTVKLNNDNGLHTRWTRTPAGNSVYVAIAGEVVNRRFVLLRNFVLIGQVSASNPLLHIHATRYSKLLRAPVSLRISRTHKKSCTAPADACSY